MHGAASNAGNAAKIVFPCSTEYACARLLTYYCSGCRCIMTDSVRTALFRSFALAGGFETKGFMNALFVRRNVPCLLLSEIRMGEIRRSAGFCCGDTAEQCKNDFSAIV